MEVGVDMGIAVTFYTCSDDPRKLDKTMVGIGTATTLHPLQPISSLEVKMQIDYQEALMSANYFLADGKYYKITDRKRLPAGGEEIIGKVDVLKTYSGAIKAADCICERSTSMCSADFADNKFNIKQNYIVQTKYLGELCGNADGIFTCYIT